jgi:hypothetical protein
MGVCLMDTSSQCEAYFGGARTVVLTGTSAYPLPGRGVTFSTFRVDAGTGIVRLPDVERMPQGTRLLVANLSTSTSTLTVANGGAIFSQSFGLLAGQMAEIYLHAPELVFGTDFSHEGAGQSPKWTGAGYWFWDIFAHTRKGPLG